MIHEKEVSLNDLRLQSFRDLDNQIQPTPDWEVREIDNARNDGGEDV